MTNIIVTTATKYFGLTQASKKIRKGWWSKDIKQARTELKEAERKFKIRQSSSDLSLLQSAKARYQNMISKSKTEEQNNITNYLNEAQDGNQLWHRYNEVLGRKNNNII